MTSGRHIRKVRIAVLAALAIAGLTVACTSATNGSGRVMPPAATSGAGPPGTTAIPRTSAPPPHASGSAEPATHPAPPRPVRIATVHSVDGVTYRIKIWWVVRNSSCAAHSYGNAVTSFLIVHPCRGLQRVLATTTVHGRRVGFNESSTGFPGPPQDPYRYARRFIALELRNGTGSINDLLREGYRLPSGPQAVPSPDAFNALGQDSGVAVWDAWYLDGPTPVNDPPLIRMTNDLFLQF